MVIYTNNNNKDNNVCCDWAHLLYGTLRRRESDPIKLAYTKHNPYQPDASLNDNQQSW